MKITRIDPIYWDEIEARLRSVRLRGHGQPEVYRGAEICKCSMRINELAPTQSYVLRDGIDTILGIVDALRRIHLDGFQSGIGMWLWGVYNDGSEFGPVPFLPPIIEESHEPDGVVVSIINDGMHRIVAAWNLYRRYEHARIDCIHISGASHPYYAFPLKGGWNDVVTVTKRPDFRKAYREPDNYKALFRDFNSAFPGIQEDRAKAGK